MARIKYLWPQYFLKSPAIGRFFSVALHCSTWDQGGGVGSRYKGWRW